MQEGRLSVQKRAMECRYGFHVECRGVRWCSSLETSFIASAADVFGMRGLVNMHCVLVPDHQFVHEGFSLDWKRKVERSALSMVNAVLYCVVFDESNGPMCFVRSSCDMQEKRCVLWTVLLTVPDLLSRSWSPYSGSPRKQCLCLGRCDECVSCSHRSFRLRPRSMLE